MTSIKSSTAVNRGVGNVKDIAKLRNSKHLILLLREIHQRKESPDAKMHASLTFQTQNELVKDANHILVEIDEELLKIHSFAKMLYSKRFPELASLVSDSIEYLCAVPEIGNDLARITPPSRIGDDDRLREILPPLTVTIVSLAASITKGKPLASQELDAVLDACSMGQELNDMRSEISDFIENHVSRTAPNLGRLAGTSLALKLIESAGGLRNLSEMTTPEIERLGALDDTSSDDPSTTTPVRGFIFYSEPVQSYSPHLRTEVAEHMALKCRDASETDLALRRLLPTIYG